MKMKTMTKMTKGRAWVPNAKREIRLEQNAIDASQRARNVIDAIPQAPNAPDATPPGRNVVGAIELEENTSVGERELAPDSDAVVGPLRSNCPPREKAFRGCGGIAPGQKFWAESVEPTTRIEPVTAVGGSQVVFHVRPSPVAENGTVYRDCNPD
jgi:hypothetical protein